MDTKEDKMTPIKILKFEKPKWEMRYSKDGIIYLCVDAPNFIHRLMQKILLGIIWRKL